MRQFAERKKEAVCRKEQLAGARSSSDTSEGKKGLRFWGSLEWFIPLDYEHIQPPSPPLPRPFPFHPSALPGHRAHNAFHLTSASHARRADDHDGHLQHAAYKSQPSHLLSSSHTYSTTPAAASIDPSPFLVSSGHAFENHTYRMKHQQLIHLVVVYLHLLLSLASASPPTQQCTNPVSVEDACKTVTANQGGGEYDFCVKTLKADARAKSADMHQLAVLVTRLAIDHATSTEAKIDELMELEPETSAAIKHFGICMDVYSDAVDHLQDALDNLNARLYSKAMSLLGSATNAAAACEIAFNSAKGFTSPLAAEDRDYARLANIAHGITATLE